MNVLLNFNDMFKWKGPLDIKWDNPFGYPNHTWTQLWKMVKEEIKIKIKDAKFLPWEVADYWLQTKDYLGKSTI